MPDADYRELAATSGLPPQDQKIIRQALSRLPARINAAKEKEMGDMMGKLKEAYPLSSTIVRGANFY